MGLIRDATHRWRGALWNHTHAGGTSGTPIAHSALSGVTADQHHAQSHAHASHTGIGADDHHPQAHTLASHSTKAHAELTGVGANDHHNESHALSSHSDTTIAALANNHVLQYNDPPSKWVNRTLAAAGIASTNHHDTHEGGADAIASLHTQNTDSGTTSQTFDIDSGSALGKITLSSVHGAANKTLTVQNAALTNNRTLTLPDRTGNIATSFQPRSAGSWDWVETGSKAILNTDGTWRLLDCSAIVPVGATTIALYIYVVASAVGKEFCLGPNPIAYPYSEACSQVAGQPIANVLAIACDVNRKVSYLGTNFAFTYICVGIGGWWF